MDRASGALAAAWRVAACVGVPEFTDGERVWVGVDVGGERSSSAVCWVNESLQVGVEIFHGEAGVLECVDAVAGARSALHGGRGGV